MTLLAASSPTRSASVLAELGFTPEADVSLDTIRPGGVLRAKTRPNAGSGRRQTVLVLWTDGTAEPGWLNQQLAAVGVPEEVGRRFVTDLAATVGGRVSDALWDTWDRSVPLTVFGAHHDQCIALMKRLAQEIRAAIDAPSERITPSAERT